MLVSPHLQFNLNLLSSGHGYFYRINEFQCCSFWELKLETNTGFVLPAFDNLS